MGHPLSKLTLRGFKSIERLDDFELGAVNVLIGANGAGKSNFVDFFRLLRALVDESLQSWALSQGGGDALLFLGPKRTPEIVAVLEFGKNRYGFKLVPTASGSLQIAEESVMFTGGGNWSVLAFGTPESALKKSKDDRSIWTRGPGVAHYVFESVSDWTVYHVHDTGPLAAMRRDQSVRDWERLRHDAGNVAAFLLRLRDEDRGCYESIRDALRLIAPFFDDFLLRPTKAGSEELVRLEWRQKGSDFPFQPHHLSDGTIRFACLATALLQPNPPATVVIDEPELGLHPYALALLADLVRGASTRTQVVVSTQSPAFLDRFSADEVVVASRRGSASVFERLDPQSLTEWLEDYTLGELWEKNVVRGGPTRE